MKHVGGQQVSSRPEVHVEPRPSAEGYVNARIEGAPDRLPRTFVGVLGSRDEAISEVTSWALGWMRRLREVRQAIGPERR